MPSRERDPDVSYLADYPRFNSRGDGGGGGDMHDRLTRIETVAENQEKLISDTRADLRGIRSDMKSMENRIVDKMDENQKWLVGLLVSAILVPLFIALVTK
ncbi:TPA: hemolysin XhlA family protein [Klebsiella pneumoniae]|uniref:hemolysin XhlA family protein n=1 Tax=Klebsiella TaxID=570 RepID=UPI001D04386F|nr:hemolysin XhlA family protein [Klebsiella pneumoniae]MCC5747230.1 hemolysin XhlA family protein [Klebsiella pneumoniae]MCQ9397145.1 hemolysin XhlA family protein [Klebsiella pneumoniae]MCQ9407311.1 hemolysin XhlA family protein [Klebsiella pneumoniae]MCQ9428860.1 hemolysin XhlA family protein [Klebsiella pneumoniae]MCQ9433919.1 hemolysin XhlA family protein [Klebsiella pneumoniae]